MGITDAGLEYLAKMKSLQHLKLTVNPQITAEGIAKLKEALPNCEIIWDGNAGDDTTAHE